MHRVQGSNGRLGIAIRCLHPMQAAQVVLYVMLRGASVRWRELTGALLGERSRRPARSGSARLRPFDLDQLELLERPLDGDFQDFADAHHVVLPIEDIRFQAVHSLVSTTSENTPATRCIKPASPSRRRAFDPDRLDQPLLGGKVVGRGPRE